MAAGKQKHWSSAFCMFIIRWSLYSPPPNGHHTIFSSSSCFITSIIIKG